MSATKIGHPAPDFTGISDDGTSISLLGMRGNWVLLYFYPKASSYGCSIEARQLEVNLPEFSKYGMSVIGISTDSTAGQASFREKCELTFPLLPDPDKTICKAYGVIGGISGLLGLASRASFIIDPSGVLVYELRSPLHTVHASAALTEIKKRSPC